MNSYAPAKAAEIRLFIDGQSQVFEHGYLKLKTAEDNAFDVVFTMMPPNPMLVSLAQASIEIDFGIALTESEVGNLAQSPPKGFTSSTVSGQHTLILAWKEETDPRASEFPLVVPLRFPRIKGPKTKPYGTILFSLFQRSLRIAMAEYSVTL